MGKLKEWCRANQKTVQDVATELGIAKNYLYEMDSGKRKPSLEVAVAIAKLTTPPEVMSAIADLAEGSVQPNYWLENAASFEKGAAEA